MKKAFLILITFFAVFALSLWGYLQTPYAQKQVLSFLSTTIKSKTGYTIEIESLSFPLPFTVTAHQIKLKNKEDVFITVKELSATLPFWDFYNKTLSLANASFNDVRIFDIPSSESSPSVNDTRLSQANIWESFHFNIRLSSLAIENLSINPLLLSDKVSPNIFPLNLKGSFAFIPATQMAHGDLTFYRNPAEKEEDSTRLHLQIEGAEHLHFRFDLFENDQGLLSEAFDLGIPYDTSLVVEGVKTQDQTLDGKYTLYFLNDDEVYTDKRKIVGGFFYSSNGQLNLHSMKGSLGPFHVDGEALLNTNTLKIDESKLKLYIPECADLKHRINMHLCGSAYIEASLSGLLNSPHIEAHFNGDNITINGESLKNLNGHAFLNKAKDGMQGKATINFDLHNHPLKAETDLHWNDEFIALEKINTVYGSSHIQGDLAYILDTHIVNGALEAIAEDSKIFNLLFDMNMMGSGKLSTKFYGVRAHDKKFSEQDIDLHLQVDKARCAALRVEKATLNGTLRNVFKKINGEIKLIAEHGNFNGWHIENLSAETKLEKGIQRWPFKITTNDRFEAGLAAHAEGHWHLSPDEIQVHLNVLQGKFKKYPFVLQQPASLILQPQVVHLSPVSMDIGAGSFYTTIDYKTEQAHTITRFTNLPLEIFYSTRFLIPFRGNISGEAQLFGVPGQLTGHLEANLSKLKIDDAEFAHVPPFDAHIKGDIQPKNIVASALVVGVTKKPIEVKLDLPIQTSLNPSEIHFDELAPLTAHLDAEGEIAPLLQLLVIDTTSLTGQTAVSLDLAGSFVDPHLTGVIKLKDGTFESPTTGAVFRNLYATMEAHDKTLVLKNLHALDSKDGVITGTGVMELDRDKEFPFSLDLQLSKIRLLNQDFAKAVANGRVTVKGGMRSAKVSGNLTTDSFKVTIPEESPVLAYDLDVKYINLKRGEPSPIFTTSRPKWPIELDLQIDVPNNASIKSKELASSWKGNVHVTGFTHAPLVNGEFKIIEGEYHYNGKTFEIKEGTISFAGDPEKKMSLYVIASKDLGKIVAEVILKGPVKNPTISFRSNPPLPQREILSYLLFGRSAGDITPFQGTELSQSVKDLTKDKNKGPDVLTRLRDSIGIDQIDITKTEGNESNDVSVHVGKYISQGVLVSVNKSITSETNQLAIEANLLPNIKCEAQVGDDSSAQLQLKWKRDY